VHGHGRQPGMRRQVNSARRRAPQQVQSLRHGVRPPGSWPRSAAAVDAGGPVRLPGDGTAAEQAGLSTAGELETAEREITHAALIFLKEVPFLSDYDLGHLCAIHRRIFADIYDWPGRSGPLPSRRGGGFACRRTSSPRRLKLPGAARRGLPARPSRDLFTERLAYYFGEISARRRWRASRPVAVSGRADGRRRSGCCNRGSAR
jgi:hypothetical protein